MQEISIRESSRAYLDRLQGFLSNEYAFKVWEITAAPRGFFGETWKVRTDVGCFFVKIDRWKYHQESYRRSLNAVAYMTDQGISHIPAVRRTADGQLSCDFDGGVVATFAYEEGIQTEDYPVKQLFSHLIPIYQLDASRLDLEKESFGTRTLDRFRSLWDAEELPCSVKKEIAGKERRIAGYANRLKFFSGLCCEKKREKMLLKSGFSSRISVQDASDGQYFGSPAEGSCAEGDQDDFFDFPDLHITHGDAGGNCILNGKRFVIMDWDSVKLAPAERDAWFFLCDEKQIAAISCQLEEQGAGYPLRQERLCYYCYESFFLYLTEYMENILCAQEEGRRQRMEKALAGYLADNWIYRQLGIADAM